MTVKDYENDLKDAFKDADVRKTRPHRYWVTVKKEDLVSSVKTLVDRFGFTHLSVIAAEDLKDAFFLNYIFSRDVVVVVRTRIDHDAPVVPTITSVVPGAAVHEREYHDLFGIVPVGHPDLRRQALPDDWPEGVFPLRKDVTIPRPGVVAEEKEMDDFPKVDTKEVL